MKRILLYSMFWLWVLNGTGQNKIKEYEFWFDNDIASRSSINVSTANTQISIDEWIDLTSLSEGLHILNYRFKDELKNWSAVASKQFTKRITNTQSHQLTDVQYWFDQDFQNAITTGVAATDQIKLEEWIDLASVSEGLHILNYRIKETSGTWSCIASKQFTKRITNTQSHQLTDVQYWFDQNFQNAITTGVAATDQIKLEEWIDLTSVSEGLHILNYRIKETSGTWSCIASKQFKKENIFSNSKLISYRYWFNDNLENATNVSINPSEINFNFSEDMDLTVIPPGANQTLNFQFADSNGKWSTPISDTINRIAIVKANFTADKTENCGPMEVQFTNNSTDGETYHWDFGDGTTSTEENPLHTFDTAGSFTISLTATNNTFPSSDISTLTDFIIVHLIPSVNLGNDVQICKGAKHTFSISDNFAQYFWNNAEGTNELIASAEGDYTLKVVDTYGCEATDVANLSFHTAPTVDLGDDVKICQGSSHTFNVVNNFTQYFWNNVEGTNELIASAEGDYTLKVVDTYGCKATDVANLSFHTAPTVDLGDDLTKCEGEELTLSVEDNFVKYFWNNSEGTNQLLITASGEYQLRVEDLNGCEASDAVIITFNKNPSVSLGNDIVLCDGEIHTFTVSDTYTHYFWNDVEGTNVHEISSTGTCILRVVNSNGCSATDQVKITVHNLPEIPVATYNNGILSSTSATEYQWYRNNEIQNGITNQEFTPTLDGKYSVKVWNQYGCPSQQSNQVEVILVGIEDLLKKNISIYPNPTKGKLVIDFKENFDYNATIQLKLYDSSGKLVLCKKLKPLTTVDLTGYSPGLYFIHFLNQNETVSFKILKQ